MAVSPQPALYPTSNDAATSAAIALLIHYFDLAPASAQLLVKKWLTNYPAIWVRAAVTEALYQGRYKPFSVEQILAFWQRRGKSIAHFNIEFETLISVSLQGGFKTEADVALEGQGDLEASSAAVPELGDSATALPGPVLAPSTTLAKALAAAEQEPAADPDSPLPRPRLMLPGELPGKGLAHRGVTPDSASVCDTAEIAPASAQRSTSEPQLPGAPALSQPQGFEGVLDPRPRPQVTQGPDLAFVAQAKSKQIQPPPIGRFTPAADPSGFASRLKTVVEQAIAKAQAEEEELSLEKAIASQLANDPVLGQPSPGETPAEENASTAAESAQAVEAIAETETPEAKAPETEAPETDPPQAEALEVEPPEIVELEEATAFAETVELEVETALSPEEVPSETAASPEIDGSPEPLEQDPWDSHFVTAADYFETHSSGFDTSLEPKVGLDVAAIAQPASSDIAASDIAASDIPEPPSASALPETEALSDLEALSAAEALSAILPEGPAPLVEVAIAPAQTPPGDISLKASPELAAPFEERFPLSSPLDALENPNASKDPLDLALDTRLIETTLDEEPDSSLTPSDNDRLDLVFEAEPESKLEPRRRLQGAIEADEADLLALGSESKLLNDEALTRHLDSGFDDDISQVSVLLAGLTQLTPQAYPDPESSRPGIDAMQPERIAEDSADRDASSSDEAPGDAEV